MGFSLFPSKIDDTLTGPSIEALKMGHRVFYGEYLEGPARGTRVLVKISSSKRATKRLVEANTDKSMFPDGLDVQVVLRSAGPGSFSLFPEIEVGWDFLGLAPGEEEEWLTGQPINWSSLQESKAQAKDFERVY